MAKRRWAGLARGWTACLPICPTIPAAMSVRSTLPLREIEPDPEQPRKRFDDDALNQLADSIAENGLLQPIAVRPKKVGPGYIIIAGERRWRAARLAGPGRGPGHHQGCDRRAGRRAGADRKPAARGPGPHRGRRGLPPADRQVRPDAGERRQKKLGKSRSAVANSLRLLALPEDVRRMVSEGKLSSATQRSCWACPQEELMRQAAAEVVAQNLNVRQTEALCKKLAKPAKPPKAKETSPAPSAPSRWRPP